MTGPKTGRKRSPIARPSTIGVWGRPAADRHDALTIMLFERGTLVMICTSQGISKSGLHVPPGRSYRSR